MRKLIIHIVLLFFVNIYSVFSQQEQLYSQITKSLEFVNPAYNASKHELNAMLIHRNQWTGFNGAPKTLALNVHYPMQTTNLGIGFIGITEQVGLRNNNSLGLTADISIQVAKKAFLTSGIHAGTRLLSYDTEDAIAYTENVDSYLDNEVIPFVGLGLYFIIPSFQAGASAYMSFPSSPGVTTAESLNFNIHATYTYKISDKYTLKPFCMVKYFTKEMNAYEGGIMGLYKDFLWLGASYRFKEAVIGTIDVKIIQKLRIGYSYDFSISAVRAMASNSHEIRLSYQLTRKEENESEKVFGR